MPKLFKKNEAVHFKNEEEKKQLLDIAVKYGFRWNSNKHPFDFEIPSGNDCLMFKDNKTIFFTYRIRVNEMGNKLVSTKKFLKRFEEEKKLNFPKEGEKLKEVVFELTNKVVSLHEDNLTFKKQIGKSLEFHLKEINEREKLEDRVKALENIVSNKCNSIGLSADEVAKELVGIPYDRIKLVPRAPKVFPNHMSLEEAVDYQTKIVEYAVGEVNKAESAKIKRHLDIFKKCVETAEAIIKSCQESAKQTLKEEVREVEKPTQNKREKGWYRSIEEGNLALLYFDGVDFLHGFNYKGEWKDEAHVCQDRKYAAIEEGTVILERESVIEKRLIREAKRLNFEGDFYFDSAYNELWCHGIVIMSEGRWANKNQEKPIEELHAEHKEAKREPKVGDFGLFWNNDIQYNKFGYISDVCGRNGFKYNREGRGTWKNFAPLPKEVEVSYSNLKNNEEN